MGVEVGGGGGAGGLPMRNLEVGLDEGVEVAFWEGAGCGAQPGGGSGGVGGVGAERWGGLLTFRLVVWVEVCVGREKVG